MKKMNLNSFLLGSYVWLISSISILLNKSKMGLGTAGAVVFILLCPIVIFPATFLSMKKIRALEIKEVPEQCSRKVSVKAYFFFFFLNLAWLSVWCLGFYPGGYSPDSISQYGQAISGVYDDWHPFMHTFVFFTLPLKITGVTGSILIAQLSLFSAILAYASMSIFRVFGMKLALLSNFLVVLNPAVCTTSMYIWKDVAFAMFCLLTATCIFNCYFTDGKWLRSFAHIVLIVTALVLSTLLRHNAILYTLFAGISLIFIVPRKDFLKVMLLCIVALVAIKGPLYALFDVQKPGGRRTETMGLPLTVIANVVKESPEKLDDETLEFVTSINTVEEFQAKYETGNFNSLKWISDTSIVEKTSTADILKMTVRCFWNAPGPSFRGLFKLTDVVYGVKGVPSVARNVSISHNDFGISYSGISAIQRILNGYSGIFQNSCLKYFTYIGVTLLIMLAFILSNYDLTDKKDLGGIFVCIPIFMYNFGTMLLLTGYGDHRFFLVSFLLWPMVVLTTFKKSKGNGK